MRERKPKAKLSGTPLSPAVRTKSSLRFSRANIPASRWIPTAPKELIWSCACRKKLAPGAISLTPSRPPKEALFSCAMTNCFGPTIHRTWTSIRKTARSAPRRISFTGLLRANPTSVSPITNLSYPKTPCRNISTVSFIRR